MTLCSFSTSVFLSTAPEHSCQTLSKYISLWYFSFQKWLTSETPGGDTQHFVSRWPSVFFTHWKRQTKKVKKKQKKLTSRVTYLEKVAQIFPADPGQILPIQLYRTDQTLPNMDSEWKSKKGPQPSGRKPRISKLF